MLVVIVTFGPAMLPLEVIAPEAVTKPVMLILPVPVMLWLFKFKLPPYRDWETDRKSVV